MVFGAARVYTFTVPGPKWKSWLNRIFAARDRTHGGSRGREGKRFYPHFRFDSGASDLVMTLKAYFIHSQRGSSRRHDATEAEHPDGSKKKTSFVPAIVQRIAEGRFPRLTCHFRLPWRAMTSRPRTGRAAWTGQADRRASDGFTPRLKQEVPVQPICCGSRSTRGSQRRRTRLRRPDLSVDRLEEELGSRRSTDLQAPEF